jgi:hypothetical protein
MAYNPFNIFRRNQKALFAVLTVFVMVVFTLSSGVAGGDFFETFSRWLGAKSGSKEAICKIDGHTVTVGELDGGAKSLQFKRLMANRFMYHAALQTMGTLLEYAGQQRERLSEPGKQMADSARRAFGAMNQLSDPNFQRLIQSNPMFEQFAEQQYQQIIMGQQLVDEAIDSPNFKSEDKDVARAYRTAFILRRSLQEGAGEHYFVNAPSKTRRDLIDFLLWKKKAEQLGIRFSKDDVKKLIQNDFYGFFKSDVEVRKILSQTQGFTMDACMEALAVEFQVRTAQTAILGHGARYHSAPALSTPYEMFEFYREKTSPAEYQVLSIPAAAFVDKVVGEPSESEINELFKKYADAEPNPRSETPGFKEPRKISIGWLAIKGDEPYYKNLATEQVKVGEVMAKMSGVFTVPLPGAVGTWMAEAVAPLSIKEPAVDAAYTQALDEFRFEMQIKYQRSQITSRDLLQSSVVRPGVVGSTLGAFVGQTAGFGNPIAAASLTMTGAIEYEIRDRVRVGIPAVMAWTTGPALMPSLVAGAAASRASEPKQLPIEALRPELIKNTIDRRAKTLAFGDPGSRFGPPDKNQEKGDIGRFIEELAKLSPDGKPKDKAAVDKYIKDFLTTRGLTQVGGSTAPRDEWTLEDDPGLAPLLEAHRSSVLQAKFMGAHGGAEPYFPFGRSFFWKRDDLSGRTVPTTGTFLAEQYPPEDRRAVTAEGRSHFVFWRTEDVQSKKMNRDTARPAVIAAWKRLEARKLALAHANAVAEKIRKESVTDPALLDRLMFDLQLAIKDPKVAMRARKFPITGVAPLSSGPAMAPGMPVRLQPFGLSESEDIPYPTLEMVTELLDNRDKPEKTVLVLQDAPKDTFYVATLMNRRLKQPSEFTQDVYSPRGGARVIRNLFHDEAVKKARESVVELLKKEFKFEETEEQKKKLDENAKSGGRNND